MERFQTVYGHWAEFVEVMGRTNLNCIPTVDWTPLGTDTFPAPIYAEAIKTARFSCPVAAQIYDRFRPCIAVLLHLYYTQPHGVYCSAALKHIWTQHPYFIVYQVLPLTHLTLQELHRMGRPNLVIPTDNKCELAVNLHLCQRWGFSAFAVKSHLNDDVLEKIKSFV
jgi:hypothetical protein